MLQKKQVQISDPQYFNDNLKLTPITKICVVGFKNNCPFYTTFYFYLVIAPQTKDRTEQLVFPSELFAFGFKKREKSSRCHIITELEKIDGDIENGPQHINLVNAHLMHSTCFGSPYYVYLTYFSFWNFPYYRGQKSWFHFPSPYILFYFLNFLFHVFVCLCAFYFWAKL